MPKTFNSFVVCCVSQRVSRLRSTYLQNKRCLNINWYLVIDLKERMSVKGHLTL